MFATLRKITLVLAVFAISLASIAGTSIKRAVVIDGKTYEKWVLTEENIKTVTIVDPATGEIIKETIVETYDDQSVVTTYKELNEEAKLVVVRIKYSSLDNRKVNEDGSVTYEYKDVTKDAAGNVVSTGATTTTTVTKTDGSKGTTTTTTTTSTTSTDSDGNSQTESSTTETETDKEGGVTETVTETDKDGNETTTVTVKDPEGNSQSETEGSGGEKGSVKGKAGEEPGDDPNTPENKGDGPGEKKPDDNFLPPDSLPDSNPENDGYDGQISN